MHLGRFLHFTQKVAGVTLNRPTCDLSVGNTLDNMLKFKCSHSY